MRQSVKSLPPCCLPLNRHGTGSMVFVLMSSSLSTVEKQPPNAKVSVRVTFVMVFHVVKITQLDQQLDPSRVRDGHFSQLLKSV